MPIKKRAKKRSRKKHTPLERAAIRFADATLLGLGCESAQLGEKVTDEAFKYGKKFSKHNE